MFDLTVTRVPSSATRIKDICTEGWVGLHPTEVSILPKSNELSDVVATKALQSRKDYVLKII